MTDPADAPDPPGVDRRFQELTAHIRFTDDVSFKLLGLVPLLSASTIVAVLLKNELKGSALLILLSVFASIVTVGVFAWELRNIQICRWCRDRAADIEMQGDMNSPAGHFYRFPGAFLGFGKTEAEKLIYATTIVAWLLLPTIEPAASESSRTASILRDVYPWGAGVILVATLVLVFAPTPLKPRVPEAYHRL